ncbi:response regulator receiver protein [Gloeothece citriformis PCC 7424]|uniref:Response regulator receiver protein n=2 Tax=Gloeothece TaxID=28070 RepID=B7KBZ2_GLOC7|nr:response regulator receiver protein [Gloeothece citriformis PCC 7424]
MGREIESMPAKKILVIDDDVAVCEVIKSSLEDLAGWDVITVHSPLQGLNQAITEQLDALILDVMMPQMDGLTLLHHLKANSHHSLIPVVLLTAKMNLPNLVTLGEFGVVGAIAKPFNALLLPDQITAFLQWT